LPACVVESLSVDSSKRSCDKFWCNQDVYYGLYDCKATITDIMM